MIIALYIIGYLIMSAIATRLVVWRVLDISEDDDMADQTMGALMGLFWPFYIAMACVIGPLWAMGWLVAKVGHIKLSWLSKWFLKR